MNESKSGNLTELNYWHFKKISIKIMEKKRDILVKGRKRKRGSFWWWKKENERENT